MLCRLPGPCLQELLKCSLIKCKNFSWILSPESHLETICPCLWRVEGDSFYFLTYLYIMVTFIWRIVDFGLINFLDPLAQFNIHNQSTHDLNRPSNGNSPVNNFHKWHLSTISDQSHHQPKKKTKVYTLVIKVELNSPLNKTLVQP